MARLALLAFALLFVGQCRADGLFDDGQEYKYSYLAFTTTGVRDPAPTGSSFGISGKVVVQKKNGELIVKINDAKLGMHNGAENLLESMQFVKKPELALLEKPFKLSYTNGKVSGFAADASDAPWSINIKKGLATTLQVDHSTGDDFGKDTNAFVRTVEDTVTGSCATSYSFAAAEMGRIALIKQRTMADCTGVPRLSRNSFDATNCAGKLQDELLASTQSYYQLSRESGGSFKPHIIGSLGYQVLQWHPPAGSPMYNLANTTMNLMSSGPISKSISGKFNKEYDNLRYTAPRPIPSADNLDLTKEEDFLHPEEPKPQDYLATKATAMLSQLVRMIGSSALDEKMLTEPNVAATIHTFSALSHESLKNVYASLDGELKTLFIEILPLTGSNPAALLVKELIIEGSLSEFAARRAIAYVPFYLRLPSEKLLTSYEEILRSPVVENRKLRAAVALSFSHLIGLTCFGEGRSCKADTMSKYTRMAIGAFKSAENHDEQMLTLMAMRNTKLPAVIESLIPLALGKSDPESLGPYTKGVSESLRAHVIYALAPLGLANKDKFLSVAMPIVLNPAESTEIRISAIATMFQANPSFLELQQLIAAALWERNMEVRNFIITTFKNYAQTKNPCMAKMAPKMELLLRRVAHIPTSHFRSSNRVFDFADQKYGFSGGLQLVTVYGEESRAPLVIAGRVNYRVAEYGYTPLEVYIRLEGVEDAFVRMFRKLDPKDFKTDTLKDLLQKTLNIAPRKQEPMKMEIILRSQGYNVFYRHADLPEIMGLLSGNMLGKLMEGGMAMTRNLILMGGQHTSWRANDLGLPVGVGLTNPGVAHFDVEQRQTFVKAHVDLMLQVHTYLIAFNPLGVSQGIMKIRGSRLHLPTNLLVGFSPADKSVQMKMDTPTKEEPLSLVFSSKTIAFLYGRTPEKAMAYLKDSCSKCEPVALVSRGDEYRKSEVLRDKNNERLGMESHIEVMNCETYTGKGSIGKLLFESFKPSEINSHGSVPGFFLMGLMQMRNYFYYYPPTGSCSMKAVVHQADELPAQAILVQAKLNRVPAGPTGIRSTKVDGSVAFVGEVERKWNVNVAVEADERNIKSSVAVKIARQAVPSLSLAPRALCVNVNTKWSDIPEDALETPSSIEPSVVRDVTFVWGEAAADECPTANAEDVSTLKVKITGSLTEAQRQAAASRDRYPYDQCDKDRMADGRSGIVVPVTEACMAAVDEYATPMRYVHDISFDNISPLGMKAMHRADTIIKAGLAPYWDMHPPHGPTAEKKAFNSGNIELVTEFTKDGINLHVHTAQMHSHYEHVDMLKNLEGALRNARVPSSKAMAYQSGLIGICNVAPESVVTFDNATLKYECPSCYTLVSADCSEQPRYAVFAKKTDQALPLAAKFFAGGRNMEFTPTESGVEVRANGRVVTIGDDKPFVFSNRGGIIEYFRVSKVGPCYYIEVPMLMLSFRYTGDEIVNIIPSTHRAQHCGMCGNYNGQVFDELVGPSGCAMKDASDMAKSYVLRDKTCEQSIPVPSCKASYDSRRTSSGIVAFLDQFSEMKH